MQEALYTYQRDPHRPPSMMLEELFPTSASIFDIERLRATHPNAAQELERLSDEEQKFRRAGLLSAKITRLATVISANALELGWLLDQGKKKQYYIQAGCSSMDEWITTHLHIPSDVRRIATDKYNAWLYVEPYNIPADKINKAAPIHIEKIGMLKSDGSRQKKDILHRELNGKTFQEMSPHEREEVKQRVEEEFDTMMNKKISAILDTDPRNFASELAQTGRTVDKPLMVITIDHINPQNGEFSAHAEVHFDNPNQLHAFGRGQVRTQYKMRGNPNAITEKDIVRAITPTFTKEAQAL